MPWCCRSHAFRLPCRKVWIALLLPGMLWACTSNERSDSSSDAYAVAYDWTAQEVTHREAPSTGPILLTDVAVTETSGVERMGFAFRKAALPGYTIQYADSPLRQCGSGKPVELAGTAILEVQLHGVQAHTEKGASTLASRTLAPRQPLIKEAALTCDFEGRVVWGLGLDERLAYRVMQDSAAGTIAVDVRR